MISKKPIYVDFGRRRELCMNLNAEILIRNTAPGATLWETIGVETDPETGKQKRTLDVNLDNLKVYLWALLQDDARRNGEKLTIDEVGAMITRRVWVTEAVVAITSALAAYYGDEPGEATAHGAK
jgi:hypothetical protein